MQDLYKKNHKILMNKNNLSGGIPYSWRVRFKIVKISVIPNLIYRGKES